MARPSKYKPEYVKQAKKLCQLGATDEDLADFFGCTRQTIHNWQAAHKPFFDALKIGKGAADDRVERSLYQRAIGYSHPDVHISNYQGAITVTPITKHYAPDATSMIFWLKNRRPDQWRDVQDHKHQHDHKHEHTHEDIAREVAEAFTAPDRPTNGKVVH